MVRFPFLQSHTTLNTVSMADDYFSYDYMSGDVWDKIPSNTRYRLIATAEKDIIAYLKASGVDGSVINEEAPYTPFQMAVFEWAVYMYSNKDMITRNVAEKSLNVSTIAIDGIGRETKGSTSRKYMDTYNDMIARSPAARYLAMIYQDRRVIR